MKNINFLGLHSRQRGQAVAEFLVAAIILVPMLIIAGKLASYIDVAQNATTASRFAGFENSMYHKLTDHYTTDLFYTSPYKKDLWQTTPPEQVIKKEQEDLTKKVEKYFFSTPAAKELVKKVEVIREGEDGITTQNREFWSIPYIHYNSYESNFGLGTQEFRIAKVNVTLNDLPWKADAAGPMNMSRYMVIGYNDHSAANPGHAKKRVLRIGSHYPRKDQYIKFKEDPSSRFVMTGVLGALIGMGDKEYTDGWGQLSQNLYSVMAKEARTLAAIDFKPKEFVQVDIENVPQDYLK